ncbi:very short patch repair endonuclease [Rhizobium sp. LEGMi198b]
MGDRVSPEVRSKIMSRIRGKDTSPEMKVRRCAHALGFRFRLHVAGLPGRPDLVFPSRRKIIFVHGCFWHRHTDCKLATTPRSNVDFWQGKFQRNLARDIVILEKLHALGWKVLVIWECQISNDTALAEIIKSFLLAEFASSTESP